MGNIVRLGDIVSGRMALNLCFYSRFGAYWDRDTDEKACPESVDQDWGREWIVSGVDIAGFSQLISVEAACTANFWWSVLYYYTTCILLFVCVCNKFQRDDEGATIAMTTLSITTTRRACRASWRRCFNVEFKGIVNKAWSVRLASGHICNSGRLPNYT